MGQREREYYTHIRTVLPSSLPIVKNLFVVESNSGLEDLRKENIRNLCGNLASSIIKASAMPKGLFLYHLFSISPFF